jgi:hypothetical protein
MSGPLLSISHEGQNQGGHEVFRAKDDFLPSDSCSSTPDGPTQRTADGEETEMTGVSIWKGFERITDDIRPLQPRAEQ